jgi:hypothetical protein
MEAPKRALDGTGVRLAPSSAQINHDHLKVELVEPDKMPAMVRIVWPTPPTIVDPKRFPDAAATVARLFAEAHTMC